MPWSPGVGDSDRMELQGRGSSFPQGPSQGHLRATSAALWGRAYPPVGQTQAAGASNLLVTLVTEGQVPITHMTHWVEVRTVVN